MDGNLLRLAIDTNLLLDWADGSDTVLDAISTLETRLPEADWLVSPVVLDELAYLCDSGQTPNVRQTARKVFEKLRGEPRFRPLLELPFAAEAAENLAEEFRTHDLLPQEEIHDSQILAEAALLSCNILLTSDEHLRSIDHEQLTWVLARHDLAPPVIATPREIVRKFFR